MEIEVNDTSAADDDYVRLRCEHPARRYGTPCRIRVTGSAAQATTVVLTNPDGRLRFPGATDVTANLSVPADGSWVSFQVSGETGSAALDDAVIEAHCRTATGGVVARKTMTVFWFDEEHMDIAVGGDYAIVGGQYTVAAGNAVDYQARARIRPAGTNCAAPQVRDLRVGIMQNDVTNALSVEIIWGTPAITWNPGVAAGTTVNVPTKMHRTITMPVSCNDVAPSVAPLYDQPGKAETLDPNSLKPPGGCAGAAAATSFDTPSGPTPPILVQPAQTAPGVVVGQVTYHFEKRRLIASFITWAALFNTRTNEYCVHRQRSWHLNIDSSAPSQRASVDAADAAPTADPVLAPTANTVANDAANRSLGALGAATTAFTR